MILEILIACTVKGTHHPQAVWQLLLVEALPCISLLTEVQMTDQKLLQRSLGRYWAASVLRSGGVKSPSVSRKKMISTIASTRTGTLPTTWLKMSCGANDRFGECKKIWSVKFALETPIAPLALLGRATRGTGSMVALSDPGCRNGKTIRCLPSDTT